MRLVLLSLLLLAAPSLALATEAKAIFAGGCFWSLQIPFDKLEGVSNTLVGYTGGKLADPGYAQVVKGDTGHYEALEVTYDPAKISYEKLLNVYWRNIDPVDAGGQFCDRGPQYRTVIFYGNDDEKMKAEDSKMLMEADDERLGGKPIVTQILPRQKFYPAEDNHQRYYKKNPLRYSFYRGRCGHDQRLGEIWNEAD